MTFLYQSSSEYQATCQSTDLDECLISPETATVSNSHVELYHGLIFKITFPQLQSAALHPHLTSHHHYHYC